MPSAETLIRSSGIAQSEARILLAFASGLSREQLITSEGVGSAAEARFRDLCAQRAAGEPVAYLVGEREFYGRSFRVTPDVLIPRPETELLVDKALELAGPGARILDLGTGSGIVAITLACEVPGARVSAVDVSAAAAAVARGNAERLGARITVIESDWFSAIDSGFGLEASENAGFDLVVANPPYISDGDPHLDVGDLRYEPRIAQTAGADGLDAIRTIIRESSVHLRRSGWLLLEHGYDQAAAVKSLLSTYNYAELHCWCDLAGIERVSAGRHR